MTLLSESYIEDTGSSQGLKLEQMPCISDTGCEIIADFSYEDELLN